MPALTFTTPPSAAQCTLTQTGGEYKKCCAAPHLCQPPNCCPGAPIGNVVCFGDGTCVNKLFFTSGVPPSGAPSRRFRR